VPLPTHIKEFGINLIIFHDDGSRKICYKTNDLWRVQGGGTIRRFGNILNYIATDTSVNICYPTPNANYWIIKAGHVGNRFDWPFDPRDYEVGGTVTDNYAEHIARGSGGGIDFGYPPATAGAPIHVVGAGTVIDSGYNIYDGNYITVYHGTVLGHDLSTIYKHLDAPALYSSGDILKDTIIGYVGNTGDSTGNHLHLSTLDNGSNIDPIVWFATYEHW
jgi:murein DD-endopeptidase MepM/ murein hydrolase activator NlpD